MYKKRLLIGPHLLQKFYKFVAWQLEVAVGELDRQVRNDMLRGKSRQKRRIHLYGFLWLFMMGPHSLTDLGIPWCGRHYIEAKGSDG